MFCMQCGKELRENARFCTFCGFEVPVLSKTISTGFFTEGKLIIKGYDEWFVSVPVTVEINGKDVGSLKCGGEITVAVSEKTKVTFRCGCKTTYYDAVPGEIKTVKLSFDKTLNLGINELKGE